MHFEPDKTTSTESRELRKYPLNKLTNEEKCELAAECWFLTGATASGKTTLAVELAEKLGGEIVSLDSMTVYRGMDIGTAKPTPEQMASIPHYMIDVCEPNESFSVSRYRDMALDIVRDIRSRSRVPIFVGGTALYLKIMLRGMFEGPPADWEFREQVDKEVEQTGLESLYDRLQTVDPVAAHKLHPTDKRRIIRALEVYKITGKPISHWQKEFDDGRNESARHVFTLRHPREILHQRIESRVHQMLEEGLVDEVRSLLDKYGELGPTASQAVGYKEAIDHLNSALSSEDLFDRILVRTRRFARQQETWFRGMPECQFIELDETKQQSDVVEQILELANQLN